jgi:hypothetical protein
MASRFAEDLLEKIDQSDGMPTALETTEYEDLIDAELHDVREVLEGLQTFQMNLGSEATERHWCQPSGGCNAHCQRARALMEKLELK